MDSNSSALNFSVAESAATNTTVYTHLSYLMVMPEYINMVLLSASMYGMYHGIEIKHPLYSVLFSNLFVSLATSVFNAIVFTVMPLERYILSTNFMSGISLAYHCNCWLSSSVLRYVYIFHEDTFFRLVPSITVQCAFFITLAWISLVINACPLFITIHHFGNFSKLFPSTWPCFKVM